MQKRQYLFLDNLSSFLNPLNFKLKKAQSISATASGLNILKNLEGKNVLLLVKFNLTQGSREQTHFWQGSLLLIWKILSAYGINK